ncbi:hypothetical protein K504DRAFT_484505 [Pleomassaria siparia CBS 279.74]|uniref:Uncharacterized protein n=1 Tax=Pleomassaria siparia CBS 279.74 TaxID=1314801 RepID=A0A6G1JZI3_9PLEO|nr:hypothetical protein K504DRAFT_484505 [Pleomassaria siparia CBS 279.74]
MSFQSPSSDEIRSELMALAVVVREMNPHGTRPIPTNPDRFNLLARSWKNTCRMCNLPGHTSSSVEKADACRVAIMSTVGFWEDVADHISHLYRESERFHNAISEMMATYEMRLDSSPKISGSTEEVIVHSLTKNYLKFQSHFAGIRPKAVKILRNEDLARLERINRTLNAFLLDGYTRK